MVPGMPEFEVQLGLLKEQLRRFLLPLTDNDGNLFWINLLQITEIHELSPEEYHVELAGGKVVAIADKDSVESITRAIRDFVVIRDPARGARIPAQTK